MAQTLTTFKARHRSTQVIALVFFGCLHAAHAQAQASSIQLVTEPQVNFGLDPNENSSVSSTSSVSADGSLLVFSSSANNLVDGDFNAVSDIFLYDSSAGSVERLSVTSDGDDANGSSINAVISGDGRYVVFRTRASNLVPGLTDGLVRLDRTDGSYVPVVFDEFANPRDGVIPSGDVDLSADGNLVVFVSDSDGIVPGDGNAVSDVFVSNLGEGTIGRASVSSAGIEADDRSSGARISGNGRFVVFQSVADNLVANGDSSARQIFLHDLQTGETARVSERNGIATSSNSNRPAIDFDGSLVVFSNSSKDLMENPSGTCSFNCLWAYETGTGDISLIRTGAGGNATGLSSDGSLVLDGPSIRSVTTGDLVATFAGFSGTFGQSSTHIAYRALDSPFSGIELTTIGGAPERANRSSSGVHVPGLTESQSGRIFIAADGQVGAFGNRSSNLFSDKPTGSGFLFNPTTTELVPFGTPFGIGLSSNGRWAVSGGSSNLRLLDRQSDQDEFIFVPRRTSRDNQPIASAWVSNDAQMVLFTSNGFVTSDDTTFNLNAFLFDRAAEPVNQVTRVTENAQGEEVVGGFDSVDLSADGNVVTFSSGDANLAAGDSNGVKDVYLFSKGQGLSRLTNNNDEELNGETYGGRLSGDGGLIVFASRATNLSPDDDSPNFDVFLKNLSTGEVQLISAPPLLPQGAPRGESLNPMISPDGRFIGFETDDSGYFSGDTGGIDLIVFDRDQDVYYVATATAASSNSNAEQFSTVAGSIGSRGPSSAPDALVVAFSSLATNLVPNSVPDLAEDVFVSVITLEGSTNDEGRLFKDSFESLTDPAR